MYKKYIVSRLKENIQLIFTTSPPWLLPITIFSYSSSSSNHTISLILSFFTFTLLSTSYSFSSTSDVSFSSSNPFPSSSSRAWLPLVLFQTPPSVPHITEFFSFISSPSVLGYRPPLAVGFNIGFSSCSASFIATGLRFLDKR